MSGFTTIADACALVTDGTHYTPKDVGAGLPFLTVKDVSDSGLDFSGCSFISESDYLSAKAGNSAPVRGDVLFSKDGTVGKVHVVSTDQPFAVLSSLAILRPRAGKVDSAYLGHVLRSPAVLDDALKKKTGSAIRRIVLGDLKRVRLPLPSLTEQRRIAAILDQAETLRTQRRAALAQIDSLTQSLFLDMFGDPLDIPKRWPRLRMSELFETSPLFGTMIPADAQRGSWLCLRVANIQDWQLTLEDKKYVDLPDSAIERHSVKAGDLLMARAIATQEHLGKCIVVQPGDEQWAFDSHLMRLRFDPARALPVFIRQMLRTPGGRILFLKASRKSSVQYNINTKEISALEIPLPPLFLQQTFATRIQAIESLKATHRAALAELDALFASLQHRAFSGELTRPASEALPTRTTRDVGALCTLDVKKMLEALIYVAKRMPEHDFYKSLKALYSGDRQHLENHGCLIYGETYEALEHGPVPKAAYALTKTLAHAASNSLFPDETMPLPLRRSGTQLIPTRDADFGLLGAAERKSLDSAIRYYGPMSFSETKNVSHDSAYLATAPNAPIAIENIIRTLPEAARRRFFG